MLDRINNKINIITDIKKELKKLRDKVNKGIESTFVFKLPDDPKLIQALINNIKAEIDDALNFAWNKICRENKI